MEPFLLGISQATGIFDFMHSAWGWPFIESLHFIGLSLLLGCVGIFDLRLLGFFRNISIAALHKLVPFGVLGFAINASTGFMFVSSVPDQYIYNPSFQLKVLCMFLAFANMLLFYTSTFRALLVEAPESAIVSRAKVFGALSLLFWMGVITGGRLTTFYRPPFHWCFWCG